MGHRSFSLVTHIKPSSWSSFSPLPLSAQIWVQPPTSSVTQALSSNPALPGIDTMNLFAGMIRGSQYLLGPYVGSVCIMTWGKKCEKMTNKQRPRNRIDELDRCILQQASSFLSCWRFLNFKKRKTKKNKFWGTLCVGTWLQ